jgi:tetratricopeptide (TPR) repeat protein
MQDVLSDSDAINFGDVPAPLSALLQQGVVAYRTDPAKADRLFRQALEAAPEQLPVYFCLYKIHTYLGNLTQAQDAAEAGLHQAARQAGWPPDWQAWTRPNTTPEGAARFALYTLKALAFIHLRQDRPTEARRKLDALKQLDPAGLVGWPVVAALADGCGDTP